MPDDTPQTIRLSGYRPTPYVIERVELDVRLAPEATRIRSRIALAPRAPGAGPLVLHGEGLTLLSLLIDGREAPHSIESGNLVIPSPPPSHFILEIENTCNPRANTQLSGLYLSGGNYCTQCEAEGFRRITYYYDRPDVMAPFTVRIEGPRASCPVLLSNGNPGEHGDVPGTDNHFAVWHDPHPKPSYLFALVAGDLAGVFDTFTTRSGRRVDLRIYVQKGKEDRCAWAMESLKASMRWDEERFGREYDLDVFMIVAVPDFNMGAMENKGLNIFNDKYILARPDTATDADYINIEAIIAHEYFHNWTGNRITCRDWFQLCLKEGLTVFRDQEFTSDIRSRAVKRIQDVKTLRARQFPEDAGPLSHPVRPSAYIEINNFYTPTVYEKGAELCRMMQTFIGRDAFRKAMDLYFERHDGDAATVEDFVACMADASGRDMTSFFSWYEQAGTPRVTARTKYDAAKKTFTLALKQATAPTPGQPAKKPLPMPLGLGLVGPDGADMPLDLAGRGALNEPFIEFGGEEQTFVFRNVLKRPVLSLNRGFSAPIRLETGATPADELFLMARDPDTFNRWEAGQSAAARIVIETMKALKSGKPKPDAGAFAAAMAAILDDDTLDAAFKALMMQLPSEADVATALGRNVDPALIRSAREHLRFVVGDVTHERCRKILRDTAEEGAYAADPASTGRRSLRYAALVMLAGADPEWAARVAAAELEAPRSMSSEMGALAALVSTDRPERDEELRRFYERHHGDHLIVDKWFALNAMIADDDAAARVRGLMRHPDFKITNPNRVRGLIGAFTMSNPYGFHAADGEGYRLLADTILELDPLNPQVAARIATGFGSWRALERGRRGKAKKELSRILAAPSLSRDTFEIVSKSMGEA